MTIYKKIKVLSPEVKVLRSQFGEQMFSLCRLRKDTKCDDCEAALAKGVQAFRPLTNGNNRYIRLCRPCVATMPLEKENV